MQVPPHPHTGLQTVTWLLAGEVRHQDSLGSDALVRPGELNLMTAGRGISHAETSPAGATGALRGLQLWVALPSRDRDTAPDFAHHDDLPTVTSDGVSLTVLLGTVAGERSPARAYTPIVGAEVRLEPGARTELPLEPDFEHAVLAIDDVIVGGERLPAGSLSYLPHGPGAAAAGGRGGGRPGVPGRGRAVRRGPADVVELRRPQPRRGRRGARGVDGSGRRRATPGSAG